MVEKCIFCKFVSRQRIGDGSRVVSTQVVCTKEKSTSGRGGVVRGVVAGRSGVFNLKASRYKYSRELGTQLRIAQTVASLHISVQPAKKDE